MLKFPRKEERKKEKEMERRERKEGRGRMKERKVKGQNGVVHWERRIRCVQRNEGAWLANRKKKIFWALGATPYFLGPGSQLTIFESYNMRLST